MAPYTLFPTKLSANKFTATWKVRSGSTGPITITVSSTDTGGGVQSQTTKAHLQ